MRLIILYCLEAELSQLIHKIRVFFSSQTVTVQSFTEEIFFLQMFLLLIQGVVLLVCSLTENVQERQNTDSRQRISRKEMLFDQNPSALIPFRITSVKVKTDTYTCSVLLLQSSDFLKSCSSVVDIKAFRARMGWDWLH